MTNGEKCVVAVLKGGMRIGKDTITFEEVLASKKQRTYRVILNGHQYWGILEDRFQDTSQLSLDGWDLSYGTLETLLVALVERLLWDQHRDNIKP